MPSFAISRRRALALAAALLVVLVAAGTLLARTEAPPAPQAAAIAPVAAAAREPIVVHVVGAVRRPGLYRLRDGARVADAVRRAGGPTRRADLAAVNLAAPLADGVQVAVPVRGPAVAGAAASSGKVSLSRATLAELDALPGVGPVTAQKILDYRAAHGGFASVDELDAIPGIGPARIEQLRELVTP